MVPNVKIGKTMFFLKLKNVNKFIFYFGLYIFARRERIDIFDLYFLFLVT